jgi:hypothetical protein
VALDATLQRLFEELHAACTIAEALSVRRAYDEFIHGLSPRSREQVLSAMQDIVAQLPDTEP